jgi:peptidoglycan/LPS O-acetylase OafA/YrhL
MGVYGTIERNSFYSMDKQLLQRDNTFAKYGRNINYFTGLNALRFFAAYAVVLHHAEQIRMKHGMFNIKEYALFNNGGIAVTFFLY